RFLSIASSYPYVMHALLSFSANHLAWVSSSADTRNLSLQHGSIALRGLHEAIGNFSHANADAVLAASLLLLWQATDWQSWSSLRAGIQSVLSAMRSWKLESLFTDFIAEEDLFALSFRSHRRKSSVTAAERSNVLQTILYALQRLQGALGGHELELNWVKQLLSYVQQLQNLHPAQTAEEQFNYLYQLRKWLFWVPISLLQRDEGQGPAIMTLAFFYATSIALEPLFPDLGPTFCSARALPPLEAILNVTNAMQTKHSADSSSAEIASLMQFPQQTAINYRNRAMQIQQSPLTPDQSMLTVDPEKLNYTTMGNLSPAFTPSTPQYTMAQPTSSAAGSYLEVPTQASFTYGTQSWGAMPSPAFPAHSSYAPVPEEQMDMYGGNISFGGFRGGFVPATIWT
ncbi:hypothetical protein M433DRAFT_75509, partial [Acidomyces richmondensis BFW]